MVGSTVCFRQGGRAIRYFFRVRFETNHSQNWCHTSYLPGTHEFSGAIREVANRQDEWKNLLVVIPRQRNLETCMMEWGSRD